MNQLLCELIFLASLIHVDAGLALRVAPAVGLPRSQSTIMPPSMGIFSSFPLKIHAGVVRALDFLFGGLVSCVNSRKSQHAIMGAEVALEGCMCNPNPTGGGAQMPSM
jgi:hypothetical protein